MYTTTQTNNLLSDELNTSKFNNRIALKTNISDVHHTTDLYTKAETNDLLNLRLNSNENSNYYTQNESSN